MRPLRQLTAMLICTWAGALGEAPTITCSFSIPADWTKQMTGGGAVVETLAGPNTDLHAYQPTPQDVRRLIHSDLIIGIHPALEPWLKEICESNKLNDKVLWISNATLPAHGEPGHTCDGPNDLEQDPHVWMDPVQVRSMIETLAQRCRSLPGIPAESVEARKLAYLKAVDELDRQIHASLDPIPAERKVVVTHHGNLGRFADRYGIRVAGVILRSSSTESADPSARALAELARLCREKKVRAVTCDRGQRAPAAAALAREAGLPPPIELSVDSLDEPGKPAGTWLGMMRDNAARLAAALADR